MFYVFEYFMLFYVILCYYNITKFLLLTFMQIKILYRMYIVINTNICFLFLISRQRDLPTQP